jgi:solute carrier family 25 S-adenosylmethionine transporter 26
MPLFMVASAAEVKPSAAVSSDVPQWRRVAANLAAGAAAGCSVEAGGALLYIRSI